MNGILRWVSGTIDDDWHLRFGSTGPTLCDRNPIMHARTRWLSEGPPARRCPGACTEVIALRLGLTAGREPR